MAIVQVQFKASTTTNPALAFTFDNTAGNFLVCGFRGDVGAIVSDSQGNSWSKAVGQTMDGAARDFDIWYAPNCLAGANTVSVQNDINGFFAWSIIVEYSGLALSSVLDQINSAIAGSPGSTYSAGAVGTTVASELLIGLATFGANGGSDTPSGGFSDVASALNTNGALAEQIVSSTGTYTYGGDSGVTGTWLANVATFKGAVTTHSISGNAGVAGATVSWTGTASGNTAADGSGNYTIPTLADGSYTVTAAKTGYSFTGPIPSNPQVVSGADLTGVDFVATQILVATPTFSPAASVYQVAQVVTVSDTDSALGGFAMYYTTDGTTPTTGSTLYSGPITISISETLKVLAVATGYANSAIASGAYTIRNVTRGSRSK